MMQGQASSAKQNAGSLEMKPVEQEREIDRFSTTDDETGHGSRTRVYLLGENRWEDSSRLIKKSKGQTMNSKPATVIMCFSCRGEGVTLCTGSSPTCFLNSAHHSVSFGTRGFVQQREISIWCSCPWNLQNNYFMGLILSGKPYFFLKNYALKALCVVSLLFLFPHFWEDFLWDYVHEFTS
jgi:hypothetical protein